MVNPIRPTDDEARELARTLLAGAGTAALAVVESDGTPFVSRVGFALDHRGRPLTLVSRLSRHTTLLLENPSAALLVGEVAGKGDPLNLPRLTLVAGARITPRDHADYAALAAHWTTRHPKAKLYAGFADFVFVHFEVTRGHLNGGFGKAFDLTPADMGMPA